MIPDNLLMRPNGIWRDALIEFASWLPMETIMAEVGTYLGESSRIFLDSKHVRFLFCVDPWENGWDSTDPGDGRADMGIIEKYFDENMIGYSNFAKMKMTSLKFASLLGNGSLDAVYIDGNHQYENVREDILAFLPKIKPGGWLCGHDISWPGVERACLEIFGDRPWSQFEDSTYIYRV